MLIPLLMPSMGSAAPSKASLSDADKQLIRNARQAVKDQAASRIQALRAAWMAGTISKGEYKTQVREVQANQNGLLSSLSSSANQKELVAVLDGFSGTQAESLSDGFSSRNGWNYKWLVSWISWLREYASNGRIF
ncbi:hypothetical protein [Methylococcus sp. BF19-07]|uniref:hypothetical protein n=1 Tax=Methylococcus sp. BF19-07 TaxID=2743472 RepID=UPI001E5C614E|nr:hypothetical protein [Methylococcus sp. BF19-07]